MTKISFIYFDLGGVVIKDFSDTDKWDQMYSDLGVKEDDLSKLEELYCKHSHEINLDYDFDNFVPILNKEFDLNLPKDFSLLDELISRFNHNPSLWPLIDEVEKFAGIGLLTNMWPRMFNKIVDRGIIPDKAWVIVDSSQEMLQKPNKDIYQFASDKAGVSAEEILFIDNTPKNLLEPKSMGWQTFHYDSSNYEKSTQDLQKYLSTTSF